MFCLTFIVLVNVARVTVKTVSISSKFDSVCVAKAFIIFKSAVQKTRSVMSAATFNTRPFKAVQLISCFTEIEGYQGPLSLDTKVLPEIDKKNEHQNARSDNEKDRGWIFIKRLTPLTVSRLEGCSRSVGPRRSNRKAEKVI